MNSPPTIPTNLILLTLLGEAGTYSNFMSVMPKTITSRQRKRVNNLPYPSPNLLKLIHKKNLLFKAAKLLSTDKAWAKFKTLRNHTTSTLRAARSHFFIALISNLKSPRDFWKSFHKLSPKSSRIPVHLSRGTQAETSSIGKANLLNCFFASCFSPATSTRFTLKSSHDHPTLTNISVEESEVYHHLSHHKINTAS